MHFFPTPYPDEILYSILARYHERSGNITTVQTAMDLFGRENNIPTVLLPNRIEDLVQNLPRGSIFTADYLLKNHSLFYYFVAFISGEKAGAVRKIIERGNASVAMLKLGMHTPLAKTNQYLRFCVTCFEKDKLEFGEPYWHRIHQIPGIEICPIHGNMQLMNSSIEIVHREGAKYEAANNENCVPKLIEQDSSEFIEQNLLIAGEIQWLLGKEWDFLNGTKLRDVLELRLRELGYIEYPDRKRIVKLIPDFEAFWGESIELVGGKTSLARRSWIQYLIAQKDCTSFSLRYIFIFLFLGLDMKSIFKPKVDPKDEIDKLKREHEILIARLVSENTDVGTISEILGISRHRTRKQIRSLFDDWNVGEPDAPGVVKYKDSKFYTEKIEVKRLEWLNTRDSTDLNDEKLEHRKSIREWLYRHDTEWYKLNSGEKKTRKGRCSVDWAARDQELLEEVQKLVEDTSFLEGRYISKTEIFKKIGINGWLRKRVDRIPKTLNFIDEFFKSDKTVND